LAVVASVAILAAIGYLFFQSKSLAQVDDELCPVDGPVGVRIVLVDTTDPLSLTTLVDSKNHLKSAIGDAKVGERIEIFTLSEKAGELEQSFAGCKPDDGSDANILLQNPRLIKHDWQEKFAKPMEGVQEDIGKSHGGNQSPIMAAIQSIKLKAFDRFKDPAIPKKLIVLSDMIEHTQSFSQYRSGTDFAAFKKSPAYHEFMTDLTGVEVQIWLVDRGLPQFRNSAHMDFWLNWVHGNRGDFLPPIRLEGVNPQGAPGANT
jgi:hypothetical protein